MRKFAPLENLVEFVKSVPMPFKLGVIALAVLGTYTYIDSNTKPYREDWIRQLASEVGYSSPENVSKAHRENFPDGIVLELRDGTEISYISVWHEGFQREPLQYKRCE